MNLLIRPDKKPDEIEPYLEEICTAYQVSFGGEPWYEKTKCIDNKGRCIGGFSPLDIGELCTTCQTCPVEAAYGKQELIERFTSIAETRPTAWYLELSEGSVALAALAWVSTVTGVAKEKYADTPAMLRWMRTVLTTEPLIWLDEVFANKEIRSRGNLNNFKPMVESLQTSLGPETVAYRTITPQMVFAGAKAGATIFGRATARPSELPAARTTVPDRRDFLVLSTQKAAR